MNRKALVGALALGMLFTPLPVLADVIGSNVPALALTAERIAAMPAQQRAPWADYLSHSEAQMQADRAALVAELPAGKPRPPAPPSGKGGMPLDRDAAWYGSAEARAIADNIVSFQTPAGGWGKNQDRTGPARRPGQPYAIDEQAVGAGNLDAPRDLNWHYVGTLDNGATTTELRFLARVAAQAGGREGEAYRASFIKGVGYLLAAQYPNGGWPQVWPLEGGYHDAITFNDDSLVDVAMLLGEIGQRRADYAFAPASLSAQAAASSRKAVDVILASQVVVQGKKTVWPQQVDMLTLAPASARNYEMPSLSSSESGGILVFLMRQPHPSAEVKAAVRDGVAWLNEHAIHDQAWTMTPQGKLLVPKPGASVIWSRYYSLTTGKPIFGDRDRTIHDNVADLSQERRNGYSWYNATPQKALDAYIAWSKANP